MLDFLKWIFAPLKNETPKYKGFSISIVVQLPEGMTMNKEAVERVSEDLKKKLNDLLPNGAKVRMTTSGDRASMSKEVQEAVKDLELGFVPGRKTSHGELMQLHDEAERNDDKEIDHLYDKHGANKCKWSL